MEPWTIALAIFGSIMASGGFWALLQHFLNRNNTQTELLLGMSHDRIMFLGLSYIERSWITQDELNNYHKYLVNPYLKMGGNGAAKRIAQEVDQLPVRTVEHVINIAKGG